MNTTPGPPLADITDAAGADIRDMIVVHTALLREFRLAPNAIRRAQRGSRRAVRRAVEHLELICSLLHHHHAGEDALLWPVLAPRLAPSESAFVAAAEAQHAGIETALDRVDVAKAEWVANQHDTETERLIVALEVLDQLLREHLEAEERYLLPLAAVHLSPREWGAIGEAGAAGVPKSALLLVFGMFCYEGDPEVLAQMLHTAPTPLRMIVPRLAPRVYARRAARLYGTRRP
ncbi:hemerythrin domain-containing protein [Gordonia aichiensis]